MKATIVRRLNVLRILDIDNILGMRVFMDLDLVLVLVIDLDAI